MNNIKSLIKNVLSEDMDAAKACVHNIVSGKVRNLLNESQETGEVINWILGDEGRYGTARNSRTPEELMHKLHKSFMREFDTNNFNPNKIYWDQIYDYINDQDSYDSEGNRYNTAPDDYGRNDDMDHHGYQDDPERDAGEAFQDKYNMYKNEY